MIITAKTDGFRRCGTSFSKTPTEYPSDAFTPDQLAALRAEPMLTIVHGDAEFMELESTNSTISINSINSINSKNSKSSKK